MGKNLSSKIIVIVDTRLPVIDIGSDNEAILIAESVVATIEVKSQLGTFEIEDALESIALTKSLTRCGEQIYKKGGIEIKTPNPHPILAYIFAYEGLNLPTLLEKIAKFSYSKNDGGIGPEAVCVLSKGVLLRSQLMPVVRGQNVTLPPLKDMKMESQNLEKDALFAFYRRFIDDVMPLQMINIDLDSYYNDSGLE